LDDIVVDDNKDLLSGFDDGGSQFLQISDNFGFVLFQDLQDIGTNFLVDLAGCRFHFSPDVFPCISVIFKSIEKELGFSSGSFEGVECGLLFDSSLDLLDHNIQNSFNFSPFVTKSNQVHDFSDAVGQFLDASSNHVDSLHDDGTDDGFELADGSTDDLLDGGQVQVGQVGHLQGFRELVDDALGIFLDQISGDDSSGDLLHGIQPVHEFLQDLGCCLRINVSGDLDDGAIIEDDGPVDHFHVGEGGEDSLVEVGCFIGEVGNGVDQGFIGLSYGIVEGFRCFC